MKFLNLDWMDIKAFDTGRMHDLYKLNDFKEPSESGLLFPGKTIVSVLHFGFVHKRLEERIRELGIPAVIFSTHVDQFYKDHSLFSLNNCPFFEIIGKEYKRYFIHTIIKSGEGLVGDVSIDSFLPDGVYNVREEPGGEILELYVKKDIAQHYSKSSGNDLLTFPHSVLL